MSSSNAAPDTTIYVLIPPSPLFAAHWSIFLPDMLPYDKVTHRYEESNIGRRIHVSGDRLNGFALEIVRQYDVKKHRGVASRRFPVGTVSSHCLQSRSSEEMRVDVHEYRRKDEDEGGGFVDNRPTDAFERICVSIEAPGPSLNKVGQASNSEPHRPRPQVVRDCQWWVRQVVETAVHLQMLEPRDHARDGVSVHSPLDIVAKLPVH